MSSPPRKDFLKMKMGKNRSGFSRKIGFSKRQRLQCEECDRDFGTPATLRRHVFEQHARRSKLICPYCSKTFARKHDLDKHSRKIHAESQPTLTEIEVPFVIKEDPDSNDLSPDDSPKRKRVSFSMPPLCRVIAESPSSDVLPSPHPDAGFQDAEVQTTPAKETGGALGISTRGEIGQRVIERTTRELLDDDGKVVARVITERFLVD